MIEPILLTQIGGRSIHGWLNFLFFRWSGWRLCRQVDDDGNTTDWSFKSWPNRRWSAERV